MAASPVELIKKIGLNEKVAKIYLAALEHGESTLSELASLARVKRTSIYYHLDELLNLGVLIKTHRKKRTYYIARSPKSLLESARDRLNEFEEVLPNLEQKQSKIFKRSRVYYLYGVAGFKQLWEKIFESGEKEFRIITDGESLLNFVKEKYIVDEIIRRKKELGIHSKQLISASKYAREIIAKDARENRTSKILPPIYKLPFTEIICGNFVVFIAPRFEEIIFIIEDEPFARTRRSLFEILWNSIL